MTAATGTPWSTRSRFIKFGGGGVGAQGASSGDDVRGEAGSEESGGARGANGVVIVAA